MQKEVKEKKKMISISGFSNSDILKMRSSKKGSSDTVNAIFEVVLQVKIMAHTANDKGAKFIIITSSLRMFNLRRLLYGVDNLDQDQRNQLKHT